MTAFKKFLHSENLTFLFLAAAINLLLIVIVYRGAFLLDLQGDTWQYVWTYKVAYGNSLFTTDSLRALRTSLGGSFLTFALISNFFGLSGLAYYGISVVLKFISVMVFFLLVQKLTKDRLAALLSSMLLAVSFAGIEATHWVFNMYAYVGLTLVILSAYFGLDLSEKYEFKKWLLSFVLACAGVWYATMRTNGIVILFIFWSLYKYFVLKTKSSRLNLISWVVGFGVFILIDKFLLGQMESDYSKHYIIDAGIQAALSQIAVSKYDFLLSPASNLGIIILPDSIWPNFDFPKMFAFMGLSLTRTVIIPSFLIYSAIAGFIAYFFKNTKKYWIFNYQFLLMFFLGLFWTIIVYLVSKQSPVNFSSWVSLVVTLFGGYLMVLSLALALIKELPLNLRNLFLLTFFWSFVFLLLPIFQNGGPLFGTYHRYLATTAISIPLFFAGLLALSSLFKSYWLKAFLVAVVFLMILAHGSQTQAFFDQKARVQNRALSAQVWDQFSQIVPNKIEYHTPINSPAMWFEAKSANDRQILFETLYFGLIFKIGMLYGWDPHINGLYFENFDTLVSDVRKNPKILDNFYAMRMENGSLINVTNETKQKIKNQL